MNEYETSDLAEEYRLRFSEGKERRIEVWRILVRSFFAGLIPRDSDVLDLGCGWGEFINQIQANKKYGMDLNPDTAAHLDPDVSFYHQDCSHEWPLDEGCLDCVFTSNFFEHLPDKLSLSRTLQQVFRCLKPGGRIICLGPNIRVLHGHYWDFYDHFIPLTEQSLVEALELRGFEILEAVPRFLPYTMVRRKFTALFLVELYLRIPVLWRIFGKQFLVIARKPESAVD